jgi:hypothetical protein
MVLRLCYRTTTNALGQDGHHLNCVDILLFGSSFRGLKR